MEEDEGNKLPSPDTSDMCEDGWVERSSKIFYIFTVVSQPWHYRMIFQCTWKQEENNLRWILAFLRLCTCKLSLPTHLARPVPVWLCTRKKGAHVDAPSAPSPEVWRPFKAGPHPALCTVDQACCELEGRKHRTILKSEQK